ncbi:uncharacterized protein PV09_05837 [Verruconis gallopava]|uniref:Ubiquitination network signaling protein acrB n=1 Tax=Verruconis gallopava TaxID=253628 RepID=A0A0D2A858_9PEZI|nr:uncharacterized protein PV09_05837 [Verruconis gallopava]KIW02775.1 hypothetical protein PV09_05837 [Verruconis gallopava]
MPPRLRRSGTHEKNSTHATGLAPPSRRLLKHKSNGALNGSHLTNGRTRPSVSPSHIDAAGLDNLSSNPSTPSPTSDLLVNDPTSDAKMGASFSTPDGRDRTASASSDDDLDAHGSSSGMSSRTTTACSPLKIDLKAASASPALSHQKTALATATTILKACPLWDVIAILIILLQLPPTIISVVQFLFAFLTFVSPTSGTSIANMPSLNEVLAGASGHPSLQTIVFLDLLMLLPFLFLWTPAQNLSLDLAQAVIAMSLGGAASSKGGTSASVFSCIFIIGISHLVRWDVARQFGFNFVWTGLVKSGLRSESDPPTLPRYPDRLHVTHGWPRKLVGVHILAQGLTRLVRRWYIANEMSASKKMDAENGSLSTLNTPRTTTTFTETITDPPIGSSTDGRPPGPPPVPRKEDLMSSVKRKKKQANYVRSQQPFWAALANAKVTFLKELEHQQASLDAIEANAMDIGNIGNANFKNGRDRVWIKEVGSSEIAFGVSLPSVASEDKNVDEADSDQYVKRFRVRLNQTDWSSTRASEEALGVEVGEEKVDVWSGKIFGLTASTSYICEFVRVEDGATIFTTHITTQPAPSAEQAPTPSAQPPSLRPLSPTTTLRNSIQAAESKLEGYRNRLRRSKREHKNIVASLQREVDSLNARLSSNGGTDERLRQKVRQLEQSVQQAKAKEIEMLEEIASTSEIPAEEIQESNRVRAEWQSEKDRCSEAQKEYDAVKSETDREIAQLKSEILALVQKRQKYEQRKSKFIEQRQRLLSEANQSQEAQSRRYHEREIEARNRADTERRFQEQTALLERECQALWAKGGQYEARARYLEDLFNINLQQQSMPTTPEGPLPGTRGLNPGLQHHNTFPGLQPGFQFANTQAGASDPMILSLRSSDPLYSLYRDGRGRSSSMLSGISGFTDDLDENPLPQQHFSTFHPIGNGGAVGASSRKNSAGSRGSTSTGSNNSSTKDPMSPAPKSLSPLGKGYTSPLSPPPTALR